MPSNCTSATITATPGVNGAALSLVQYSVDGGNTYTTVPLSQLPFSFVVPGSGNINLITRAYDISSQSSARSTIFTIPSACVNARQPQMFAGSGQNTPVGNPFISPLVVLVQDSGGNPVPGVTVNFTLAAGGAGATLSATSATTGPDGKASVTATANSNAGNYTVVAGVTGFSTTVLFTLSNSDFGVSSSTPALIIPHGQSASITLTLTSINNFTQPISFSCSGLSTGATCGFSPKTVTPQGAAVTTTLTVSVAPAVSYQRKGNRPWGRMRLVFVFCLLGIGLRKGRKLTTVFLLVAVITLGALLLSCGGGFAPVSGVANQTSANSATSTVTVTASSGQLQHRTSFVLTMQ